MLKGINPLLSLPMMESPQPRPIDLALFRHHGQRPNRPDSAAANE